jgi:hypothetical protein
VVLRQHAKDQGAVSQPFAQLELVHEDWLDVARSLVQALGGVKTVGPKLFPQKTEEAAARYLYDCLNPERNHALDVDGFLTLLRWAREKGVHLGMYWLADQLDYARPSTIDPDDARAELQRKFVAGVAQLELLAKRLQR